MKDKSLLQFMLCAFGITWIGELVLILLDQAGVLGQNMWLFALIMTFSVLGPGFGTYIVWKKSGQIGGFKEYVGKMVKTGNKKTVLVTLFITMAVMLITNYIFLPRSEEKWFMFILYIPYMFVGGGLEELGWRRFLHPYIKERTNFLVSVLVVAVIWAVWHIPLWFVSSTTQASENFFCFLIFCVSLAMILAVVYEITKNALACILIHAWSNVLFSMFQIDLSYMNVKTITQYLLLGVIAFVCYIIYDLRKGKSKSEE